MERTLFKDAMDEVLSRFDTGQVTVTADRLKSARMAGGLMHQHSEQDRLELQVEVREGGRSGIGFTDQFDGDSLDQVVERARGMGRFQRAGDLPPLPGPSAYLPARTYYERTAELSPEDRSEILGRVWSVAREAGLDCSASLLVEDREIGVGNSLGLRAYSPLNSVMLKVIMGREAMTGYAEAMSRDVARIDPESVAREAASKVLLSDEVTELPAGEYPVVLEPKALAEMIYFLMYQGFRADLVQGQASFLTGRLGEQVVSPLMSVWDDPMDDAGMPLAFDAEGVPKRRLDLIRDGVALNVTHDSRSAWRARRESTGHATPNRDMLMARNKYGTSASFRGAPIPENLFMAGGEVTRDELIRDTDRAILITRFHYSNVPDAARCVATGTSRDGIFLIEKGCITKRLKNMRFLDSVPRVLNGLEMISSARNLVCDHRGVFASYIPTARLSSMRFIDT